MAKTIEEAMKEAREKAEAKLSALTDSFHLGVVGLERIKAGLDEREDILTDEIADGVLTIRFLTWKLYAKIKPTLKPYTAFIEWGEYDGKEPGKARSIWELYVDQEKLPKRMYYSIDNHTRIVDESDYIIKTVASLL